MMFLTDSITYYHIMNWNQRTSNRSLCCQKSISRYKEIFYIDQNDTIQYDILTRDVPDSKFDRIPDITG